MFYFTLDLGSGDSKPLEEVQPGVGPGRVIMLYQPLPLSGVIAKLKKHLNLPNLRLALSANANTGKPVSTAIFSVS